MRKFWRAGAVLSVVIALIAGACTTDDPQGVTSTQVPAPSTSSDGAVSTTTTTGSGTSAPTTEPAVTSTTTTIPLDQVAISVVEVDAGFDNPVLLVASPDDGADLVVEQPGLVVRADGADHAVVLDIRDDVAYGGEQGLLGLAVHPEFAQNGLVYVNYTDAGGATIIEQFEMRAGTIDTATRVPILTIPQPAGNHNGGMIAFGPDGYLWIGMGDGGASNDRFGNGQDADTLLGSMLRIEVGAAGVETYAIPTDNPFADGSDGRPEVWAVGLRNPWRFAFDAETLWLADVGQERIEEVNAVPTTTPGLNFGWSIMEGTECFQSDDCDTDGLVLPITEYTHDDGCSITGGEVYRGSAIPSLTGQYFFSDFCSGILRSISLDGSGRDWSDMIGRFGSTTGFGTGADGEMYIVTKEGSLFTIEAGDLG